MESSHRWFIKKHFENILDCWSTLLSPWPPCKALASGRLVLGTAPVCGLHVLCVDFMFCVWTSYSVWISHWRLNCVKKADETKNRVLLPLPVWHSSPVEHLAIYCSFPPVCLFFSCRCFILSRQTLTHQVQGKLWWLPEGLHWQQVAAEVEAAFLGRHQHIFIWRWFGGGGPPSISWVRLLATDPGPFTWAAGLRAAGS